MFALNCILKGSLETGVMVAQPLMKLGQFSTDFALVAMTSKWLLLEGRLCTGLVQAVRVFDFVF